MQDLSSFRAVKLAQNLQAPKTSEEIRSKKQSRLEKNINISTTLLPLTTKAIKKVSR